MGTLGLRGAEWQVLAPGRGRERKRTVVAVGDTPHYDIVIIGTGARGGTLAHRLAPGTSALDVNCKAHDLDNLYVVDTSFFPSIGAVNPSLTAIANALRVGDHLLARLG